MPHRARSERLLRFIIFLLIASVLALSAPAAAHADPAAIDQAQKEAQELRALIDRLGEAVSMADEEYNQAAQQLEDTKAAEGQTQAKLNKAQRQLDGAQQQLMRRLADIYKGGRSSMLEVFFGATSFSDMVNRLGQLKRISQQDSELIAQVEHHLQQVEEHKAELAEQKKDEQAQLARLAEAKEEVEHQLAAQQKALEGKETQVAQLQKEERERQARLAAAAKAAAAKAAAEADRQARLQAEAEAEAAAAAQAREATLRAAAEESPSSTTGTATTKTTNTTKTTAKSTTTTAKPKATTTTEKPASSDGGSSSGGSGASGTRAKVIDLAMQYLGVPYVWAGESPSGFDCSGLVKYVFAKVGISLPHSSAMQYGYGTHVSKSELKPGDLVFFYSPIHHVGIYIGDSQMINARTGGVQIDNAFWSSYVGATRVID